MSSDTGIRPIAGSIASPALPIEIVAGIWWIQLPLGGSLQHVNVYLLDDGDRWTLIDTGTDTDECRAAIDRVLSNPAFSAKPLARVLVTHHHPDHIGLAGWLSRKGCQIMASETCWKSAQRLLSDPPYPGKAQLEMQRAAGLPPLELEAFARRPRHQFAKLVSPLPSQLATIEDNSTLLIGQRAWKVIFGGGHATDHVTLWSDDQIAIVGDQILNGISPNLCVHACESGLDPLGDWIDSCHRFGRIAQPETKCLPGHNVPFLGISKRCEQMLANQNAVLERLIQTLIRPQTAIECLPTVFRRPIEPSQRPALLTQTMGYLNHLKHQRRVRSEIVAEAILWSRF
ncbi:MBL fold metallo-hydrolase [Stieleria varia]|uniref:MBL fold metallo-hydrolase n=1 Tax=Stieleria varia TaxID=2528005 RepID=UPI0018D206C7|nr:MBL fold metallo-hydrolase [Stieleria varia]